MNYLEKLLSLTALSATLYSCGGAEKIEPELSGLEQQTLKQGNYTLKDENGEINFLVVEDPISAVGPKIYNCLALLKVKENSQILLYDNGCNDTVDYVVRRADSEEENVLLRFQLILSGQVSVFDGMMKSLINSVKAGEISPTNLEENIEEKSKHGGVRI